MQKMNKIAIGKKLRELRKKYGYITEDVAIGVNLKHRTKVSQVERGSFSFGILIDLCRFYNFPLKTMLKIGEEKTNNNNTFSSLINAKMLEKNIDKNNLRMLTGSSIITINSWLSGNSFPSITGSIQICKALDVELDVLLKSIDDSEKRRFKD